MDNVEIEDILRQLQEIRQKMVELSNEQRELERRLDRANEEKRRNGEATNGTG